MGHTTGFVWNAKAVQAAIRALKRHETLAEALPAVQAAVNFPVGANMLEKALKRFGHSAPSRYLKQRSGSMEPQVIVPAGMAVKGEDHPTTVDHSLPARMTCDGDNHYPIHDPYVEAAKLKFMQDFRPEAHLNVGDLLDFWPLSQHEKEPERWFTPGESQLQDEIDAAKPYWREVRRVTSGRVGWLLGNHENRLRRFIGANLGLFRLKAFDWERLAELPAGVQVIPYGSQVRVGALRFEHGDKLGGRMGVKNPAVWLLDNKGNRNTIFGHHHRCEVKHRTVFDEDGEPHQYVAIAQGHSSDVKKQRYIYEPNWQHGFTAIEFWTRGGRPRFTAHPIVVVAGRFSWGGKVYDGGRPMPWMKHAKRKK